MNEKCKFNYVNIHRVFKSLVIKTQFQILASLLDNCLGACHQRQRRNP